MGDTIYSTNNKILINNYRPLNAISCVQKTAEKNIITEKLILHSNKNGFGNQVGTITNRATAMIDIQSNFDKDSDEYKELSYRIICSQHYQQSEIDKIKGVKNKPMPSNWFTYSKCNNDLDRKIVVDKKPYFMIYIYPNEKKQYKRYVENCDFNSRKLFDKPINELDLSIEKEREFYDNYYKYMPVILSNSTMNRICRHIELEFKDYVVNLKHNNNFDYTFMRVNRKCFNNHREEIAKLHKEYSLKLQRYSREIKDNKFNTENIVNDKRLLNKEFRDRCEKICNSQEELLNITLDLCYSKNNSKSFCWDIIGDLIIKSLKGEI